MTKHFLWNFMWGFEDRIGPLPLPTAHKCVYSHIKESSIFNLCFLQILELHFLNITDVWCGCYPYFLSMQKASLCKCTCEGKKYRVCSSSASVPRLFFIEIYLNTCTTLVGKHFLTPTSFIIFWNLKWFTYNAKQSFLHNSNQVRRVSKGPAGLIKSVYYIE